MRQLIVLRTCEYSGILGSGYPPLRTITSRGKRHMSRAAEELRLLVTGRSFRVFSSTARHVREAANLLAKRLGKSQAIGSEALDPKQTRFIELSDAMDLICEQAEGQDTIILVVEPNLADQLPAFFAQRISNPFLLQVGRRVSRCEGILIDVETRSFKFVAGSGVLG